MLHGHALWGSGALKAAEGRPAARLGGAEKMILAEVLCTSTLLTPLITAAGRSLDHARCSHSTFFEPDVYTTFAKLIFHMFSKIIKNAIFSRVFNILNGRKLL